MNIRQCTACVKYVEESDMERINGKYYCYQCFAFCKECDKPFHTKNPYEETYCLACQAEIKSQQS